MLKRVLRSRRGEGYIDVCVLVICAMLVIALAVMGQSPAAAVITLFHSLANIFREQNQLPSGGIMVAVDRKLLRKIKAKKIAQGHKADDHEPKIGLQ